MRNNPESGVCMCRGIGPRCAVCDARSAAWKRAQAGKASEGSTQNAKTELQPGERVVRHPEGYLMIERLPLPTQEDFDKKFASLAKAWPVLAKHADHIDGEFDNALTDVRAMVRRLLARVK